MKRLIGRSSTQDEEKFIQEKLAEKKAIEVDLALKKAILETEKSQEKQASMALESEKLLYDYLDNLRGQRVHARISHKVHGEFEVLMQDAVQMESVDGLGFETPKPQGPEEQKASSPEKPVDIPTGELRNHEEQFFPPEEGESMTDLEG